MSCKYHLIISTWTLEELSGLGKIEQAKMFFSMVKKKIINVFYNSEEKKQGEQKSDEHKGDALHIIIVFYIFYVLFN